MAHVIVVAAAVSHMVACSSMLGCLQRGYRQGAPTTSHGVEDEPHAVHAILRCPRLEELPGLRVVSPDAAAVSHVECPTAWTIARIARPQGVCRPPVGHPPARCSH